MKKGDLWMIVLIFSVASSLLFVNWLNKPSDEKPNGPTSAQIVLDGEVYQEVDLTGKSEMIEIQTARGYDLLKVNNGGIEVVESDCPEKICMGYGQINQVGEIIVCLPNRMIIEIIGGGNEREIDAIAM